MSNQPAATPQRSIPNWLALSVLSISAAWLLLVGSLWLATGKSVPLINVRWASSVSAAQRMQAEQEWSLILREPVAGRTGTYYATSSDEATLSRIVSNPLVADTAHISRSKFVLEDAPYGHLWIGDRWTVLKQPTLLFAAVVCGFSAAAVLLFPGEQR